MVNVATISPLSPGAIGSFGGAATVQPQELCASVIPIGLSPVFLYLKCATAVLSDRVGCNSTSGFSQTRAARAGNASARTTPKEEKRTRFFMMLLFALRRNNAALIEHTL